MLYFVITESQKKIDLSNQKILFNEENDWFTRETKSDFSFPFTLLKKTFLDITDFSYNYVRPKKQYPGKLYRDGQVINATLKIQSSKGKFVDCIIFAGLENLPGFDKKLSEFPLQYLEVDNIKEHALTIITQDYPAVNYNFPMLHTDQYDSDSGEFNGFEKILNNFFEGNFINNVLEEETNIDLIKNIMQPVPYVKHVLITSIESLGYTLAGDILTLEDLNKALLVRDGDYYNSLSREIIPFRFKIDEWDELAYVKNTYQHVLYNKSIVIEKKGDYLLYGQIVNVRVANFFSYRSDIFIGVYKVSGGIPTLLYSQELISPTGAVPASPLYPKSIVDIDLEISFEAGDILQITKTEIRRDLIPVILEDYPEAISLDLQPVRYRNPDNSPIISLLDLDYIDLTRVVPDVTLNDVIMQLRLLKNLDFVIEGSVIKMDFIFKRMNRNNYIDLQDYEIEEPYRPFNDDRTYELSFKDGKNYKEHPYDSIFVTSEDSFTNDYKKNDDTTPIEIDLLPLPIVNRNGIITALILDDDATKIRLAFYNSVPEELFVDEKPIFFENPLTTLQAIYFNYYRTWIDFLINSISLEWEFIISVEKAHDLNIKSIIFCYKNFHVIREIERERLLIKSREFWRLFLKTESLPLTSDPLA